ncbi:MAG: sulfotransferase [Acidimicrobiales bacterium]
MTDPLSGLVPIHLEVDQGTVHLVQIGATRFTAPFYDELVASIAAQQGSVTLDVADLHRLLDPPPPPLGLVFHVGRCGSTLVQRMLAQDPGVLALGEPLTTAVVDVGGQGGSPAWPDVVSVFALLEHLALARGQRSVIRHVPLQAIVLAAWEQSLPDVPKVFLWRDPVEVVGSNCADQPRWWTNDQLRRQVCALIDEADGSGEDPVAVHARLWDATVRGALDAGPDLLVVDHADLMGHPAAVIERIADHLGLHLDPERAGRERRYYAKSHSRNERFDPEGRHRRDPLDPADADLVRSITDQRLARISERTWRPDPGGLR